MKERTEHDIAWPPSFRDRQYQYYAVRAANQQREAARKAYSLREAGCEKSAQGPGNLCVAHGGGYKCTVCKLFAVQQKGFKCWTCRKGTEHVKQYEELVSERMIKNDFLRNCSYRDSTMPCSSNRLRGDFTWILPDRCIILEGDEHCHRHYERDCEITRTLELHEYGRAAGST